MPVFKATAQNEIITIFVSLFLLSSITLKAQTQTNFSGRWEFDKAGDGYHR